MTDVRISDNVFFLYYREMCNAYNNYNKKNNNSSESFTDVMNKLEYEGSDFINSLANNLLSKINNSVSVQAPALNKRSISSFENTNENATIRFNGGSAKSNKSTLKYFLKEIDQNSNIGFTEANCFNYYCFLKIIEENNNRFIIRNNDSSAITIEQIDFCNNTYGNKNNKQKAELPSMLNTEFNNMFKCIFDYYNNFKTPKEKAENFQQYRAKLLIYFLDGLIKFNKKDDIEKQNLKEFIKIFAIYNNETGSPTTLTFTKTEDDEYEIQIKKSKEEPPLEIKDLKIDRNDYESLFNKLEEEAKKAEDVASSTQPSSKPTESSDRTSFQPTQSSTQSSSKPVQPSTQPSSQSTQSSQPVSRENIINLPTTEEERKKAGFVVSTLMLPVTQETEKPTDSTVVSAEILQTRSTKSKISLVATAYIKKGGNIQEHIDSDDTNEKGYKLLENTLLKCINNEINTKENFFTDKTVSFSTAICGQQDGKKCVEFVSQGELRQALSMVQIDGKFYKIFVLPERDENNEINVKYLVFDGKNKLLQKEEDIPFKMNLNFVDGNKQEVTKQIDYNNNDEEYIRKNYMQPFENISNINDKGTRKTIYEKLEHNKSQGSFVNSLKNKEETQKNRVNMHV